MPEHTDRMGSFRSLWLRLLRKNQVYPEVTQCSHPGIFAVLTDALSVWFVCSFKMLPDQPNEELH